MISVCQRRRVDKARRAAERYQKAELSFRYALTEQRVLCVDEQKLNSARGYSRPDIPTGMPPARQPPVL